MNIYIPAEPHHRVEGSSVQEVGLILDGCQLHCMLLGAGYVALDDADPVLGEGEGKGKMRWSDEWTDVSGGREGEGREGVGGSGGGGVGWGR